jgi:membrane-associated protease RseP (regulator of RpoE activity)
MEVLGWAIFLFAFFFSIMLHETGHFLMAKKFGMKVTRYFVGFGPTLWSTWRGETEYGVKAIPLGGFVKIIGMHSLDDVEDPADEPRAFRQHPAWQRIIVLCAGSFMHFLLAFLLVFGLVLGIGIEDETTVLGTVSSCVAHNDTDLNNGVCGSPIVTSPAKEAGLKVGDRITSFDGTKVTYWSQLSDAILSAPVGSRATLTVLRHGKTLTLHTTLASVPGRPGAYIGIAPTSTIVFQGANPWRAITYSGSVFEQVLVGSAKAVADLPAALPKDFGSAKTRASSPGGQVSSVIGAGEETASAVSAQVGWEYKVTFVLFLVASLNIFVGAFNMLPLLPLDGGHVAAVIWERIRAWFARVRGRPDPGLVDYSKLLPASFSIFLILVVFSLVLVAADIWNPLT